MSLIPLHEPTGGLSPLVTKTTQLHEVAQRFGAATGPIAADAERASGHRYGQATYLIQLRRAGAGTALIDTVAVRNLAAIQHAVGDAEFVIHAASQDLAGLREHGLQPARLFDTELAGRLLGLPRVALGTLVAEFLGYSLAKKYSSEDWSRRPLPSDWLRYAALDVELLLELRSLLAEQLEQAGKLEWAYQEFANILAAPPPPPRQDPWRRTSGLTALRDPRELAIVRALWYARERAAKARDLAPRLVLSDAAIVAAAAKQPRSVGELVALRDFSAAHLRRRAGYWQRAIESALRLPPDKLPSLRGPGSGGPPAARTWPNRDPAAASRLATVRSVVRSVSEQVAVPAENLLLPDSVLRFAWQPPAPLTVDAIGNALLSLGARPWQVGLLASPLADALKA